MGVLVEQIIAPRSEKGIDHGATAKVLIRKGTLELRWRKGSMYWLGVMGGQTYSPCCLEIIDTKRLYPPVKELFEGGRLSIKRLKEVALEIDEVFGESRLVLRIDLKKSLVLK